MPSIDADGIAVGYGETGAGAPVVLVHSSACTGGQWRPLAVRLDAGFHMLTPDLYGYGATADWPGTRPLAVADEAALIHAVIDIAAEPVHLVGHSYGGAVALRAAAERPDKVARLTLIEPAAFYLLRQGGPREWPLYREIDGLAATLTTGAANGDYRRAMARFVDYWNGDGAWTAMTQEAQTNMVACVHKIAAEFHAIFAETATIETYRHFHMPVTILRGGRSPKPVVRIAELLAMAVPQARLITHAEAGHMMPMTHPDLVAQAIVAEAPDSQAA